ncbi:MAG: hypothetical protein QOI94_2454 [Acidobacteriaceae bacterium]|jgi:hypothetical protein|nr:hypothetical protein [Acidobacteriaceae bacterium]
MAVNDSAQYQWPPEASPPGRKLLVARARGMAIMRKQSMNPIRLACWFSWLYSKP